MADVALGAVASPALPSTLMAGVIATAGAGGIVSPALGKGGAPADPFAAMLASLVATDEGKVAVATTLPTVQSVLIPQPATLVRAAGAKPAEAAVIDPDLLALAAKDGDAADRDAADGDSEAGDQTSPDSQLAMMLAIAEPQAPPAAMTLPAQIVAAVSKKMPEEGAPGRILASTAPIVAKGQAAPAEPKDGADATAGQGAEQAPNPRAALFARLLSGTATPIAAATADAAPAKPQTDPVTPLPSAMEVKVALATAPLPQPSAESSVAAASIATSAKPQRAADRTLEPPVAPLVSGVTAEVQTAVADTKVSRPAAREPNPIAGQPGRLEHADATMRSARPPVNHLAAPPETPVTRPKVDLQADAVAGLAGQAPVQVASAESPAVPNSAPSVADGIATRTLSIASDTQWLDTLARDIAATAGKDGSMSFRLDPQHLGSLTVHITHGHDGASIRLSADTEAGRAMLTDAQPRLAAEARAQGLTLKETSVDLGGSNAGQSHHQGNASTFASLAQGQSQRDSGRSQTFINPNAGEADEPARTDPVPTERSDLFA